MFGHTRGIALPDGSRFFGFRKDHPKFAGRRLSIATLLPHFGAAAPARKSSLSQFRCPIFDQGQTSSCIGHGSAQLDYTAMGAAGQPLIFVPSPKHNYDGARIEEIGPSDPLTDSGAMPSDLETAHSLYGIRDINLTSGFNGLSPDGRFSDVWPENVNIRPDFEDAEQGGECLVAGEYDIPINPNSMIAQMQAVIDIVKRPIGLPWFVDSAVMGYKAGDPPIDFINTGDPNGGGHWTSLDEYDTMTVSGTPDVVVLGIPNSWSADYGNGGVVQVTARALIKALLQPPIAWTVRRTS
jgi:hypothetical protein